MSAGYPRAGDYVVVWQVEDYGMWIDYDPAFCRMLEDASDKGTKAFEFRPRGNITYTYNLQEMYQQNERTSTRRPMRRVLWWNHEVDQFAARKRAVDVHNENHSDPRAGRRPSGSPARVRSRSQSQARGAYGGPARAGAASSSRGSGG